MCAAYGRVFPSKTLINVPAFARALAQAYARENAGAKVKGGGVIPESGCEVGVASMFCPGQNRNGRLSWMGFCPGTWMGFCPGTWMGFCLGTWMGFCPGTWMGFWAQASGWVLPGHLDGVLPGHLDGVLPRHLDCPSQLK